MGLCNPCREERHKHHTPTDYRTIRRKGLDVKSRTITCECVCRLPSNWREIRARASP